MIVYSVIMFVTAAVLAVFAVLISKGNTHLINCYHEDRVKDKTLYCRKIGQALLVLAAVLTVSGIVGLLGETDAVVFAALGVLVVGMIAGMGLLFHVQKKFGGGLF